MSISARRVRAIFRKELREYRRNGPIVAAMAILPLIFLIQPLVLVFATTDGLYAIALRARFGARCHTGPGSDHAQ